jgi:Domain of unknown function (DUF5122) beta-propeller
LSQRNASRQASIDLARSLAVARDGKLVVAGLSRKGERIVWAIARYAANGRLDPSFGSGGRVATRFGPLWVTRLALLSATRMSSGVLVRRRTASQFDARGFNVYREQNGDRRRANRGLIKAKRPADRGAAYGFLNWRAAGSTQRYWLQEVTVDGTLRWLGQVTVRR